MILAFCPLANATGFSFGQAAVGSGASISFLAQAYGSNLTAGQLLIVAVHWGDAVSFTSLIDTQGNTWTQIGSEQDNGVSKSRGYYATAKSSAADSVTLTVTGSTSIGVTVGSWNAPITFSVDGSVATNQNMTSQANVTVGPVTTTKSTDLIVHLLSLSGGRGFTDGATPVFTERTSMTQTPKLLDLNNPGTIGNFSDSGTMTGGTTQYSSFLIAFKDTTPAGTILSGTFSYANGAPVSGILSVRLERSGIRNSCVTGTVVMPTTPVLITVTAGVPQGTPALTPTDCLNSFQPYLVQLKDTNGVIVVNEHWYVTQPNGAFGIPATGNKYLWPVGLATATDGNVTVIGTNGFFNIGNYTPGSIQAASIATGSITGGGTVNLNLSWPSSFGAFAYAAFCSALDAANPLNPSIYVSNITSQLGTGITATVTNSSVSSQSGTVTCYGRYS